MSASEYSVRMIERIQQQADSYLNSGQVTKSLLLWRGAARYFADIDATRSREITQWADYFERAQQVEDDCMLA